MKRRTRRSMYLHAPIHIVREANTGAGDPPHPPGAPPKGDKGAGGGDGGGGHKSLSELLRENPAYQGELNDVIEGRLAQFRRNNPPASKEEREELDRLRGIEKQREKEALEKKGEYDRIIENVRKEYTEKETGAQRTIEGLLSEIKHDRCITQLTLEATQAGAMNPQAIAKLLQDRVTLDEDRRPVVLAEDGKTPWVSARTGKPVSIKELIEKHKTENGWAYKAETHGESAGSTGAGTSTSDAGVTTPHLGDLSGIDKQIKDAEDAYEKAHIRAQQGGDPAAIGEAKKARRVLEDLKKQKADAKNK